MQGMNFLFVIKSRRRVPPEAFRPVWILWFPAKPTLLTTLALRSAPIVLFTTPEWCITDPARKYKISTSNAPFCCRKKISTEANLASNHSQRTECFFKTTCSHVIKIRQCCNTIRLISNAGAGSGNRTRIISLEGWGNSHYTIPAYSADYRNRTGDPVITSQLLCLLS